MASQQIAGPKPSGYADPVDVSAVMTSSNPKELYAIRTKLEARIAYLSSLVSEGSGDAPSPGSRNLTVQADVNALYGQYNALNIRLAGVTDTPGVIPWDPNGRAALLWQSDGSLTEGAMRLLSTIGDDNVKTQFYQGMLNMGTFASFTTRYLHATGRPKIEAASQPAIERSFVKVRRTIANSNVVLDSSDPTVADRTYGLSEKEISEAKKSPQWNKDLQIALDYCISEKVIIVTKTVEEGGGKSARLIAQYQAELNEYNRKTDKTPRDIVKITALNDKIMQLRAQKG